MGEAGIFTEDDRVELLDGDIVEITPIGSHHAACMGRLTQLFAIRLGKQAIVWVQNPVRLDDRSEPQPDLVLLKPRPDFYAESLPRPEDVLLLIEVADTTLQIDREFKLPLYAKAGIREVWIVDLEGGSLEAHRQPTPHGYQVSRRAGRSEILRPEGFSDLDVPISQILP